METHSIFLPGKLHGQRSLVGHSPWVCKESDMTEHPQHNEVFAFFSSCIISKQSKLASGSLVIGVHLSLIFGLQSSF